VQASRGSLTKLGCRRSESKFVSTLLQETLNLFDFSFGLNFLRLKGSPR
jgi:hypothetical protein